ncbi:MAG: DUF4230 domain-containing protein [Saprospiraceae bacterium]|nr:DUF4230 domain-containing protein [Saprospiraceae bacterium]
MLKKIIYAFVVVFLLLAGFWVADFYRDLTQKKVSSEAVVLLESIKKVTKLVAVEGYFSEVYDYKDYYGIDFSLFRKKALLRVKAKVSVGYDFERLAITSDAKTRTINIGPIGKPQILSIDHTIDYYDITQGTFNSFTNEDYNRLNQNAKDFIIGKVKQSDLMKKAEEQKDSILATLESLVASQGWQINLQKEPFIK